MYTEDKIKHLKLKVKDPDFDGEYLYCSISKGEFKPKKKYKGAIWQFVDGFYFFHCPHCATINKSEVYGPNMCIVCNTCDEHTFFTFKGATVRY